MNEPTLATQQEVIGDNGLPPFNAESPLSKGDSYYLDYIRSNIGGEDIDNDDFNTYRDPLTKKEAQKEYKYGRQIEKCGRKEFNDKTRRIITFTCKKLLCPKCGGNKGKIHKTRYHSIIKRNEHKRHQLMRQLIFTVPMNIRYLFRNWTCLNALLGIVQRIISKEFGVPKKIKIKKGYQEKEYGLDKPAIAILHIFSDDTCSFNPHVNVLVFQKRRFGRFLPKERLDRIKKSYKRALQAFLHLNIPEVDVHYKYCLTEGDMKRSVWYLTTPFSPDLLYKVTDDFATLVYYDLITIGLNGFRFIRYWGTPKQKFIVYKFNGKSENVFTSQVVA